MTDPLEHLWLMRWASDCLVEGRSPFFCPGLNAPTGVPLGYFPTLHVQTIGYLLMGLVTSNDLARFDVLWFAGFVGTGLGTFVLGWWATRRVVAAWLAGLGAMLCGPMLMHAHGHLETMQVGAVPLFLIAWIRFVDAPARGRLIAAILLYLLMVGCAPYFAVLAVFPAAWYVAWAGLAAGRPARARWLLGRLGWLAGFAGLALAGLAVVFAPQIWAAVHGFTMARTRAEFDRLGAPPWSTFVPSPLHGLGRLAVPDVFAMTGFSGRMSECSSYLGVGTLGLLAYAAIGRVRFARAEYWWSALALMVVLSWGSALDLGVAKLGLPAGWIYGAFPPFHLIRVPARFNLFAAVCAAVPAAAGLADLLARIGRPTTRAIVATACAGLMLADLAMVPFETSVIPPMPAAFQHLTCQNPAASVVDAPMFGSSQGQVFSSLWGYWQSIHHARTTAGYPGLPNVRFEAEVVKPSPFSADRLADPSYLITPRLETFGPAEGVDTRDYAWLFLRAHGFDHLAIHQGRWTDSKYAEGSARMERLLLEALVFEDADVAVFDAARLQSPTHLTWLCARGFRPRLAKPDGWAFGVLREARIVVVDPTPDRPIVLELVGASAFARDRSVEVAEGDRVIDQFDLQSSKCKSVATKPFLLGAGLRELRLIVDGDDVPARYADRLDEARTPYALRIRAVRVRPADDR